MLTDAENGSILLAGIQMGARWLAAVQMGCLETDAQSSSILSAGIQIGSLGIHAEPFFTVSSRLLAGLQM